MPVILIKVIVGNRLDDSTRSVVLSCDSRDSSALNNLGDMVDMFIELNKWSGEKVNRVERIKPVNISSSKSLRDEVERVFNSKLSI